MVASHHGQHVLLEYNLCQGDIWIDVCDSLEQLEYEVGGDKRRSTHQNSWEGINLYYWPFPSHISPPSIHHTLPSLYSHHNNQSAIPWTAFLCDCFTASTRQPLGVDDMSVFSCSHRFKVITTLVFYMNSMANMTTIRLQGSMTNVLVF